jgi:hypothetical protein
LSNSNELSFALGYTDHHWHLEFLPGCHHGFQQNAVRYVEMADCDSVYLTLLQSIM